MSDIKWIKITTDMFDDEKIDFIASLPESDAIIVIWIRLLTLAGKCNAGGYIYLTEKIPYTEEMIAHKFKKPINTVKMALETFRRLDMLDMEDNVFFLPNWEKHQNINGMEKIREQNRIRKQLERQRKRELLPPTDSCHVTVTEKSQSFHATEVEVDKELDLITTTTTDEPVIESITDVHQKVFGTFSMTGLMSEFVTSLLHRGYTEVFIKELMYEAGESSGGKPSLKYIQSIADRWIKDGIYTRIEAKRRRESEKPSLKVIDSKEAAKRAVDMEIARNRWIAEGKNPDDFIFDPTA